MCSLCVTIVVALCVLSVCSIGVRSGLCWCYLCGVGVLSVIIVSPLNCLCSLGVRYV